MLIQKSCTVKTLAFLLLALLPFFVKAQYNYLLPYYENGKYGYCDTNAVVKIKPQFINAQPFVIGYGFVELSDNQMNIIDTAGKLLLPANYPKLNFLNQYYYSNIAVAQDNDGKGYVYDLQNHKLLNEGVDALFGTKELQGENSRYFIVMGDIATNRGIYDIVLKKFIYKTSMRYFKMEEDKYITSKIKGRNYYILKETNSAYSPEPDKVTYAYLQNGLVKTYNKSIIKQPKTKPEQSMLEEVISMPDDRVGIMPTKEIPAIALYKSGNQVGVVKNEIKTANFVKRDSLALLFDTIIFPCGTKAPSNFCIVKLHSQWGIWDWKQNLLSPVIYDTITKLEYCSYFKSSSHKKTGLFSGSIELLKPEYDKITNINNDRFLLQQNNSYGYYKQYFYTDSTIKNKSLLIPCNYEISFLGDIAIYPVNCKLHRDPANNYSMSLEGTPYLTLIQKAPDYKFMYNHKVLYMSLSGKKFYK